ncbi:hypothetical protein N7532_003573 [Penicillium argentinense]|uniref:PH domain-containing protein n=1 Tax=Penicillium argentinense TaxID=1131581 RepID=A0A9W9FMN2_9EURO|nr:uncharacterized protein N7532_003573 [Penicillium argentinense]KAJ5103044.1 hypothetical protein N7532_003573 [Penicillium argentinense]
MSSGLGQRPLSEVSPMAQRRNSPIWNQTTKMPSGDSTAYDVSPLNNNASPRLFWKGRESPSPSKGVENCAPYDPEGCYVPARRPSLENLKRASRVKNHSMFRESGQEYEPTQVSVPHRPLAIDRSPNRDSQMNLAKSQFVDNELADQVPRPHSPSKDQPSPSKSSLSKGSRYGKGFDPAHDIWSEYDSAGHRHAKSVTFDAAPPQVNEYEMRTPDPSSVASESRENSYESEDDDDISSFEHDSFMDREDSFDASLEDIEKTPVVLPEDWRFMSPGSANGEEDSFVEKMEDQNTDKRPASRDEESSQHSRVDSLDSNGERRPLPPLPSVNRLSGSRPSSPEKLAAAFELGSGGQRVLPAPPAAASYTKSDINGGMSLEERLRLMMLNDRKAGEIQEEPEHGAEVPSKEDPTAEDQETPAREPAKEDMFSPPRISRDSILRDIRKNDNYDDDVFNDEDSQLDSSPQRYDKYDPDVPIPSLETDYDDADDDDSSSVIVKEEAHDEDLYSIPGYYQNTSDNSLSSRDQRAKYDEDSNYSLRSAAEDADAAHTAGNDASWGSGQTTPIGGEENRLVPEQGPNEAKGAPAPAQPQALDMASIRQSLNRPVTPEIKEEELSEPSTPDSVIRHPVQDEEEDDEEQYADEGQSSSDESVPEPIATIKASGKGLKTRPSLTPADVESMAATRRKISGQHAPPVPVLPSQTLDEPEKPHHEEGNDKATDLPPQLALPTNLDQQRQSSLMQLDIPFSIQEESLGSGLNKEFDRVIESQKVELAQALSHMNYRQSPVPKSNDPPGFINYSLPRSVKIERHANCFRQQRGYLMRQNTKVVIASNRNEDESATPTEQAMQDPRGTRSAGSSPRKPSQQTWTTVPWNGSTRRPSIKMAGSIPKKKPVPGAVPPLPGQQSNVQEPPATIEENEPVLNDAFEDGEERGRLFVKVVGLKYLDLPMPRGERSYFALTLDNGLHCVTTSWLELGKTAPIGQEFELIVQNDLEFQLTLQMKVDETRLYPQENAGSPSRQKTSTLSRVFASPRRRKELDLKQQMQSQQQKAMDVNAPVYDRLRNLIARDGSFGRAYVALSDHEKMAYGRPYTVDIACFNEWAVDENPSSVKSKKSATSMTAQRRPPYKIGKLELQLLFVPKPKGGKDEDMPKSMNACIREMRDAESVAARSYEGFLSQQGGDCPFWRRRFFKLQGSKLTAYHETTRQPRATINLAKAAKLIDDRSSLTQKETSTRNGGRRKSAFAEEEEGYMFVEEGFRIRFANGEVIDFYADSAADKDGWLRVMSEAVGKGSTSGNGAIKPWAELVLKRERSMKTRRLTTERFNPPSGIPVAPGSPTGKRQSVAMGPPASAGTGAQAPQSPRPRHKHTYSQPEIGTDARRQKTRSLMF